MQQAKNYPLFFLGQSSLYCLIFREERQNRKVAKLLRKFEHSRSPSILR